MQQFTHRPLCLLVEDSDEDADTLGEALRQSGISVDLEQVCSGDDCMAALRAPAARRPALVLMDLNTPGMDGRAALRMMKSEPTLRTIPVIVLSTSTDPRDLDFCYALGANAYHIKPVRYQDHVSDMIALLDYWLTRVTLPGGSRSKS